MQTFYAQIQLDSPLSMHPDSTLAGLLWAILTAEAGGDWHAARGRIPLSRDVTDTVWAGSVAFRAAGSFSRYPVARSFAKTISTHQQLVPSDPDGQRRWLAGVRMNNGPYINVMNWYGIQETPELWFCGEGDIDEIRRLLQQVTHIGALRNKGFGRVVSVDVAAARSERFCSKLFIDNNGLIEPMCPVPIRVADFYNVDQCSMRRRSAKYEPPMWKTLTTACVVPSQVVLDTDRIRYMVGAV